MGQPTRTRGRLVVLVGPSAVGKSTVVARVRELVPDLWFSVSATTRDPRPGEVDGRDYHFVSRADFDRMIADGELLEWADIHGGLQRSGTPLRPVEQALESGVPVLLEVDLVGARNVRRRLPEAHLVFLAPPSWDELESRLRGRGTETPEAIDARLATARTEMAAQDEFDHVIVNSRVDRAADELVSLLVGPESAAS
ncbi:guanylate kinase Gmk [Gordonia polyisoprenivorans VH2]|uniref:Guanylate kinase n=2 Tax=Gordonia polyisoprenivorans TaxID=84595 RepID=H6N0S2_GORPV|nr:guanylate kinase [Gordonia polyisoprenivorans]AFA73284.1 guanylate kinase Gmk [Gordonia polyisoprenivorans VH2]NKY02251.1 guanylate kinase [Gordonia polyisoprenivorans]OZC30399.1 guanylate kinase [Gordonia polyisoprenivorans]QUD85212.1 guanylate kinase [Gordonia polyisoprenivorans]UZF58726.1 guanylate kinase [Gordonia polyisoprenivorans]